jgi:DNA-binding transcriptional MocR family regulator
MNALCDALDKNLPANCSYRHPEGGYFVWIKLPEGKSFIYSLLFKEFSIISVR